MNDKHETPRQTNNIGGFEVSKSGISCFTCKCRRNLLLFQLIVIGCHRLENTFSEGWFRKSLL